MTGISRVTTHNMLVQRRRVKRGDPVLVRMGVPSDFAVAGELEIASVAILTDVRAVDYQHDENDRGQIAAEPFGHRDR